MNRTTTKKTDDAQSARSARLERVAARVAARLYGGVWRPKAPNAVEVSR